MLGYFCIPCKCKEHKVFVCVCVCLWKEFQPISGRSLVLNVRSTFIIISQCRKNCWWHRSLFGTSTLNVYTHTELPTLWSTPCLYPSSPALKCSRWERHHSTWGSSSWPLILDPIPSSLLGEYSISYPCLIFTLTYHFSFLFNHKNLVSLSHLKFSLSPLSLSLPPPHGCLTIPVPFI